MFSISFFALVDLFTVMATIIADFVFTTRISYSSISSFVDVLNYFVYLFQTVRILRVLRVHKHLDVIEDKVSRFLYQLALSFIVMLLFGKIAIIMIMIFLL